MSFDFSCDPCHVLVTVDEPSTRILAIGIYTVEALRGITPTESEITLCLLDARKAWVHTPLKFEVTVSFDVSRVAPTFARIVRVSLTKHIFQFVQSKVPLPAPLKSVQHHGSKRHVHVRASADDFAKFGEYDDDEDNGTYESV